MANEIWASDTDYPAGGNPWNETPTKVEPDLAEIAAGHEPATAPPAQVENWWKNRTDTRLTGHDEYLAAEREIWIAAVSFQSIVVGAKGQFNDGERWIVDVDSTVQCHYGLQLPAGTTITHVQFHYRRGTAGNLSMNLERMAVGAASGGSALVDGETDNATDGALVTNDVDAINHELAVGYVYWLRFSGSAAAWAGAAEFIGATIYYTPPAP